MIADLLSATIREGLQTLDAQLSATQATVARRLRPAERRSLQLVVDRAARLAGVWQKHDKLDPELTALLKALEQRAANGWKKALSARIVPFHAAPPTALAASVITSRVHSSTRARSGGVYLQSATEGVDELLLGLPERPGDARNRAGDSLRLYWCRRQQADVLFDRGAVILNRRSAPTADPCCRRRRAAGPLCFGRRFSCSWILV